MCTNTLQTSACRQFLIVATAAVLGLTGCSDHPPMPDPQAEMMSAAAAKPTLVAKDNFFGGKLLVEANLGQGFNRRGGPGGGPGGVGRRGRGKSGGHGSGDTDEMGAPGGGSGGAGIALQESSMPPVALRLRLTNMSKETIEVTFVLCKSELGDFAVRPERLALAPEQTSEPDAMRSTLGLTSDELVLRVSLKMGGVVEQKDLILKTVSAEKSATSSKP